MSLFFSFVRVCCIEDDLTTVACSDALTPDIEVVLYLQLSGIKSWVKPVSDSKKAPSHTMMYLLLYLIIWPLCRKQIMTKYFQDLFESYWAFSSVESSHIILLMKWQVLNFSPQSCFEDFRYKTHMKESNTSLERPTSQPYFPEDLVQKCCVTVRRI